MEDETQEALALKVRKKIYKIIEKSPGLHFRELQRRSHLAIGSLQYHLDFLQKKHLIRLEKNGKFVRYYSIRGKQLGEHQKTMSLLRQTSIRRIVLFLLQKRKANNFQIAHALNLSPSTTSFHLNKMLKKGLLQKKKKGRESIFYLTNPEELAELIVNFKKSFLDSVVDSFVEIWEQL